MKTEIYHFQNITVPFLESGVLFLDLGGAFYFCLRGVFFKIKIAPFFNIGDTFLRYRWHFQKSQGAFWDIGGFLMTKGYFWRLRWLFLFLPRLLKVNIFIDHTFSWIDLNFWSRFFIFVGNFLNISVHFLNIKHSHSEINISPSAFLLFTAPFQDKEKSTPTPLSKRSTSR